MQALQTIKDPAVTDADPNNTNEKTTLKNCGPFTDRDKQYKSR